MRKLWLLGLSFLAANAYASGIYNPGSSSGGGGGGTSSLQVTRDGVQVTSPTSSQNYNSQGFILGAVGSTSTIALNPATTDFIHNQTTLQTASFNVSSAVVNSFYVNSSSAGMSIVGSTSTFNLHKAGFVLPYRHYAYVSASAGLGLSGSITIYDVSNPTSPVLLNQKTLGFFAGMESMDIQGKTLYAASFASHTLVAYDISSPANPVQIGALTDATNLSNIEQIRVVGNYIYASANGRGFTVVDISNPSAMKVLANIAINHALSVQIRYPYAYVTQNDSNCKLFIIDISTPSSPTTATTFNPNSCTDSLSGSDFYGKYMYIGSNTGNNIYVVNVSSPLAPVFVSSVSAGAYQPLTLRAVGPYLYFTSPGDNTIVQYSLNNPALPVATNHLTDNTNLVGPDDLYFNGSYLFTTLQGTGNSGGLALVNIGSEFAQSATFGSVQTDELEVSHDATINRLAAGTSVTSPFVAASGYLSGYITTLSSNAYVAGSTFAYANNGSLSIGQINWNGGNSQTNYVQGIVSPGTFTWVNTQGISVSTISVTSLSTKQIPYVASSGNGLLGTTNLQWDNSNQVLNLNGASDTSLGLNVGCGGGTYCTTFDNNQGGFNEFLGFTRSAAQEGRFGINSSGSPDSGPMWTWRLSGSNDLMTLDDAGKLSIPGNGGGGLSVAYGVAVGSMTASSATINGQLTAGTYQGGGLATCGDSTHALNWTGGSFGCQSGFASAASLFATSSATGTLATSLFATSTATGTIVSNLLVSTNAWSGGNMFTAPVTVKASTLTVNNTTTNNAILINQTGNVGASSSIGGALNITNTSNTGAALVAYSNQAAPSDNLVNLRVDNNSFTQSAIFVDFRGGHTGTLTPAISIVSSGTASGYALNVVGKSTGTSSFQLSGNEASVGTFKVTHTSPTVVGGQSDANAAAISIALAGAGTAAQGLFIDAASGTTGKLLNVRNGGNEQLTIAGDGTVTARYGVIASSMTTSSETVNGQFKTTGNSYLGVVGSSTTFTGSINFGSSPVKTANYVMASTDTVILASGSFPSPIQITLPSASSPGQIVIFYKVDNSTTAVVLKGNGSDLIFTTNTYTFYARGEGGTLMSDGTGWIGVGQFNYHANTAGHYLNQVAALALAASSDTITSPLILNTPISVCAVRWGIATPGNGQINVGIYDGTTGVLITSTGPVSVGSAGYNSSAIPPVMLGPGNYLLALQINNTTTTISRAAPTSAIGCYKQTGASMALPNPISLATISTTNCPLIDLVTCGGWTQ